MPSTSYSTFLFPDFSPSIAPPQCAYYFLVFATASPKRYSSAPYEKVPANSSPRLKAAAVGVGVRGDFHFPTVHIRLQQWQPLAPGCQPAAKPARVEAVYLNPKPNPDPKPKHNQQNNTKPSRH